MHLSHFIPRVGGIHVTQSRKNQLHSGSNSTSISSKTRCSSTQFLQTRFETAATITTARRNHVHSTEAHQDGAHIHKPTVTPLRTKAINKGGTQTMYRQRVPYHMLEVLF